MKGRNAHYQSMSFGSAATIHTSLKVLTPRTRRNINLQVMGFLQTGTVLPKLENTCVRSPRLSTTRKDLCGSCGAYWKRGKAHTNRELPTLVVLQERTRPMAKSVVPHPLRIKVRREERRLTPSAADEKSTPSPWSPEDEVHL